MVEDKKGWKTPAVSKLPSQIVHPRTGWDCARGGTEELIPGGFLGLVLFF